ncbi:hypothetical protein OMO38_06710 [Chryseobacterium sp. 09-1422]|uniref:Uncharacterized protein n=1 Tax=Chryseobacterium kimseyorum TaxID=2984028 RepID=A0ABT3HWQ7_9FLAO|nr:hypothetical protein [Chryseobacterium kimseyorum]MCW3168213.1 hypothetical protein [Chryseobacterium kimseyorum]
MKNTKQRTRQGSTTIAVGGNPWKLKNTNNEPDRVRQKNTQMGTYKQIFYHIVFGTKNRKQTINEKNETKL